MSLRNEQCRKVCRILDDVLANRPTERDALIVAVTTAFDELKGRKAGEWTNGSDMPPMKHRNGKPKKFWPSLQYCSVCGHEAFDDSDWGEQLFDFCPYCGADMRGESNETD